MKKNIFLVFTMSAVLMFGPYLSADDREQEEPKPYTSSTSFSLLVVSGNSKELTLGFDTEQSLTLKKNQFQLKGSVIYSQSDSTKDSELYYGHLKYKRELVSRAYVLGLARFEKNENAGFKHRYSLSAGAGYAWIKKEEVEFSSEVTLGFSDESNIVTSFDLSQVSFLALLTGSALKLVISANSYIDIQELFFLNLKEASDFRFKSYVSLTADISKALALKFSYQIFYSHKPVPGFHNTDHYFFSSLVLNL